MEEIKLSIIIPAYNVEKYIEKSVRSVLNQTLKEIEIIVINDGSTDDTKDILNKLEKEDKRLKVLHKKNGGLSSARNAGLKICCGKFIAHLDGDDWIEQDAYELMYKAAIENNLDIVVSDYYDDYEEKKIIYKEEINVEEKILNNEKYLKEYFSGNGVPAIWSKIYKKNIYKDIFHPENISIGEDLCTLPKLILKAKRIGKVNKAFVHYMNNLESMSRDKMSLKLNELIIALEEIELYFKKEDEYIKYKEYILKNKILHLSNFIYYTPYWQKDIYLQNNKIIFKFFSELESKKIRETLKGLKKIYYLIQKKINSTLFAKLTTNCIWVIKKIKRKYYLIKFIKKNYKVNKNSI